MVSQRDIIIKLIDYFETLGIVVNIAKNKARGNQGLFTVRNCKYRIDVSKEISKDKFLKILIHEFAHYVHYCHAPSLNSLSFVFDNITEEEEEELLKVSVEALPKEQASFLYSKKQELSERIKSLSMVIKKVYPNFKTSNPLKELERKIKYPAKYFIKYDKIICSDKIYTIENLASDFKFLSECEQAYIRFKSAKRALLRINSRINKLNKYYNTPTELWARFCELFFTNRDKALNIAPNVSSKIISRIENNEIKELKMLENLLYEN